jgi:sialidase-1
VLPLPKYLGRMLSALSLCLGGLAAGQEDALSRLVLREVPLPWQAEWRRDDFENCTPAAAIRVQDAKTKDSAWLVPGDAVKRPEDGHWLLRHPAWTKALLNVSGNPGPLMYDPKLKGEYDIILNLRAVDPRTETQIRLVGEAEFETVRTAEATRQRHFSEDVVWRKRQRLDGRRVEFRASPGFRCYLQGLTFVPAGKSGVKRRVATDRVTVAQTPGRHYAFPGLARLKDGELVVVFRDGVEHVCAHGRIALVRSKDGGRTWTKPVTIADTPSDERDPSVHVLPDGRMLVTMNVWNSWLANPVLRKRFAGETARIEADGPRTYTGAKMMVSDDGGSTWGDAFRIPPFSPHGPRVANDGSLYYIGARTVRPRRRVEFWRAAEGDIRTWQRISLVADQEWAATGPKRLAAYGEPNVTQLPDGTWLACLRVNSDGLVRTSRSTDGGVTWSEPETTPVRGFPQHLLPLQDGRILMTYGYRFHPAGVRAVLSSDGGRTWDLENEIILRLNAADWDLGYPVSLELEPGLVLTVYYISDKPGNCFIEGAFYRP